MTERPAPTLPEPHKNGPFSFYPPIRNIEHNEWRLKEETWSEIHVVNAKTGLELWIPRAYLGEASCIDQPVMIVGLTRELEYKAGTVWPYSRRVIEMPAVVSPPPAETAPLSVKAASTTEARSKRGPESRVSRLILTALVLSILVYLLLVVITRGTVSFRGIEQLNLSLTAEDDYYSIVRKLGVPTEDRWREGVGELQYRLLGYHDRPYYLILMGTDRQNARYIGAMSKEWKPIDYVQLPNGASTLSMLRRLPRF